jgi:U3 small nucleolar RNA-associated protein 25
MENDSMLKLMTMINVSAAKPNKRKRSAQATYASLKKRGGSRIQAVASKAAEILREAKDAEVARNVLEEAEVNQNDLGQAAAGNASSVAIEAADDTDDEEDSAVPSASAAVKDAFDYHFAAEGEHSLAALVKTIVGADTSKEKDLSWEASTAVIDKLGEASVSRIAGVEMPNVVESKPYVKVVEAFDAKQKGKEATPMQIALTKLLGTYQDVMDTRIKLEERESMRRMIAMHAMSHIHKNRRRVLRNNEKLAKAASTGQAVTTDTRDQGFTRPKVLVLLPLRNSAMAWMSHLTSLSGCPEVDNLSRFQSEYSLPANAIDKLAQPEAREKYPADHIETFKANIDDNFRIGAKLTRKSWRIFSPFYDSDVILASPLGLRLAIEKDRDYDFLSSIEMLIVDQMDVMTMQNWDHVQFVMSHLNQIPKQAHDADFSRIKQWYLDSYAPYMRQSILISSYDSSEFRSLSRSSLKNVGGKVHLMASKEAGVLSSIRSGIRQTFTKFPCNNIQLESQLRIETFLTKTFKTLQKSALSRSKTLIFVPHYFDFVQLQEKLRKDYSEHFNSFAMLTEYSSGKEIARSRTQFFNEKKKFLIVTERFVFYRRYILRGAKTIVLFGLPDHKDFYAEMLENMFDMGDKQEALDREPVDVGDVSVLALYSKYDYLKLERIVGTEMATRMVGDEKNNWRFA